MNYILLFGILAALVVVAKYLAQRAPQGKMKITGRMVVDNRHTLVSVMWEEKEHLLLLGPQGSLVVAHENLSPVAESKPLHELRQRI